MENRDKARKQDGGRDEYEEERIELESDPSPDEDDIGEDDDASDEKNTL
jgi:hypothetical protein